MQFDLVPAAHVTNREGNGISTNDAALRAAILITLRTSVTRVKNETPITHSELRESMRPICADAHRRKLRAEQLLILVKVVWWSMPDALAAAGSRSRRELLVRVVTAMLDEFYEGSGCSD
jgi:hypothetical protein